MKTGLGIVLKDNGASWAGIFLDDQASTQGITYDEFLNPQISDYK